MKKLFALAVLSLCMAAPSFGADVVGHSAKVVGKDSYKLLDSNSDPNVVQIFNSDQTHLYATLQTVATERQDPTGDTAITLAEQGGGKPDALLKWFYPGRDTGHEFVYSGQQEKQLAQDTQQTIVANQQPTSDSETTGSGN